MRTFKQDKEYWKKDKFGNYRKKGFIPAVLTIKKLKEPTWWKDKYEVHVAENYKKNFLDSFKTKSKALKFAKSYMKKREKEE